MLALFQLTGYTGSVKLYQDDTTHGLYITDGTSSQSIFTNAGISKYVQSITAGAATLSGRN